MSGKTNKKINAVQPSQSEAICSSAIRPQSTGSQSLVSLKPPPPSAKNGFPGKAVTQASDAAQPATAKAAAAPPPAATKNAKQHHVSTKPDKQSVQVAAAEPPEILPPKTYVTSVLPAEGIIPHILPRPHDKKKQLLENEEIQGQVNVTKKFDHYCDLILYAPMNGTCIHCGDTGIKQCYQWTPPKIVYRLEDWPLYVQGLLVRRGRTNCGKTMMTYDPTYIQSLPLGLHPVYFTALGSDVEFFSPPILGLIQSDVSVETVYEQCHIALWNRFVQARSLYQHKFASFLGDASKLEPFPEFPAYCIPCMYQLEDAFHRNDRLLRQQTLNQRPAAAAASAAAAAADTDINDDNDDDDDDDDKSVVDDRESATDSEDEDYYEITYGKSKYAERKRLERYILNAALLEEETSLALINDPMRAFEVEMLRPLKEKLRNPNYTCTPDDIEELIEFMEEEGGPIPTHLKEKLRQESYAPFPTGTIKDGGISTSSLKSCSDDAVQGRRLEMASRPEGAAAVGPRQRIFAAQPARASDMDERQRSGHERAECLGLTVNPDVPQEIYACIVAWIEKKTRNTKCV